MPTDPVPADPPSPDPSPAAPPVLRGSMTGALGRRIPGWASALIGVASFVLAAALLAGAVDTAALSRTWRAMVGDPLAVGVALAAFAAAFVVRAAVWCRVLPTLPFGQSLAAVNLSLGANHVLPLRLGEPFRVLSVVRRAGVGVEAATASTVALRAADILAVVVLGAVAGPAVFTRVVGPWGWLVFAVVAAVGTAGLVWLRRLRRTGHEPIALPGPVVAVGTLAAWLLEAVLVWQCAHFAGIEVTPQGALLVTCAAVAAQTVAIAPSGLGTYEAASVAAYVALGFDPAPALAAALGAHALKTAYSILAGGVAVVVPSPGLLGRFRLHPPDHQPGGQPGGQRDEPAGGRPGDGAPRPAAADGTTDRPAPVVLVLPAHDEAATVGSVVRRAPSSVGGHPVAVVVVDDGSSDATADEARAAGAVVVCHPTNRGLGAAVRTGFAAALDLGAAAVAFCDADGEYAPEELGVVVGPVLAGEADYVVGSRFRGTIHHMRPHRRLGNEVLTVVLSWIARRRISDGQSGYRALSADAAAAAEICHDFNYAQVLTLDLLGKGYRYAEVPITYRFREHGRSFVRLGRYLRSVAPAVYRELNPATA